MLRTSMLRDIVQGSCGVNPIATAFSNVVPHIDNRYEGSASEELLGSGNGKAMDDERLVLEPQNLEEGQSQAQAQADLVQQFLHPTLPALPEHAGLESIQELSQSSVVSQRGPQNQDRQKQEAQSQAQGEAWAREFLSPRSPVSMEQAQLEEAWKEAEGLSQSAVVSQKDDGGLKVEEVSVAQPQIQAETNKDEFHVVEPADYELPPNKRALEELIAAQSFEQEIENDVAVTLEYLNKASSLDNPLELAGIEVYKRALTIIAAGNMQVIKKEGSVIKPASENQMPISSYLCHGARVLIEIPEGEENDRLFNWLTSGDQAINGASDCKTQSAAAAEGKYVYNRYAATHGVIIEDGHVYEDKGLHLGAKSYLSSRASEVASLALSSTGLKPLMDRVHDFDSSARTKHYGIDLTLGTDRNGIDRIGRKVEVVDGEHGHLYIFYQRATKDSPGAILIGVEGSSPDSPNHSKLGASDPYSPSYGSLWEALAKKKGSDDPDCVIGDKYNGLKVKLTQGALDEIVKIDVSKVDNTRLVSSIPSESVDLFLGQNMQSLSGDIVPGAYVSSSSLSSPSVSNSSSPSLSDFESSENFDPLRIDHSDGLSNKEELHKTPSGGGDHDDDDGGDNEGGPGNDDDDNDDNNGGPGDDEAVDAPVVEDEVEAEEAEDSALTPTANNDDSSPNIALILSGLIMLYAYSASTEEDDSCDDISDYDGPKDYGSDVGEIGAAKEWMLIDPV